MKMQKITSKVGFMVTTAVFLFLAAGPAFASGIPPVQYGTANAAAGNVTTALTGIAATIRDVLGATALVALVVAALVNHFVHDQRAKDRAKEIVAAAVGGLLIAAFAPAIVNWFGSL